MGTTTMLVDGLTFGEGPRWHDGRLWFTDGPAGTVNVVEDGRVQPVAKCPKASGLGWLTDGTLVVSTFGEAAVVLISDSGIVRHDLATLGWSTNDMVVRNDRIYVDLYQPIDDDGPGAILLLSPDGDTRIVASGLAYPNGLVISDDGSTLLASETFGERVIAFTISDDGGLENQRVFADLGAGRKPDGLCLDAEGAVWVGCYDTGEFIRVREGGEITDRVAVSSGWAVAPALGGTDGTTLYMVINETTHEGVLSGESTGRIETIKVDVPAAESS